MAGHRWKFEDPADPNPATKTYTFAWNPKRMSSPFPERSLAVQGVTAPGARPLVWEGPRQYVNWTFEGALPTKAAYEALRSWVLERKGRIWVTDHFGRRLTVLFKAFRPEPVAPARPGRYWYHTYTVEAIVLEVNHTGQYGEDGPNA